MPRSNLIILATFILVLSAGMVVGRLWAKLAPVVERSADHQPSWLADQLELTTQQRQQMDAIWADTKQKLDKAGERRAELDRDREQAVLAMLTPAQQKSYQKIIADFRARRTELEKERHDLIHDADQRSEALLNPDQKTRWEQLRNNRHGPHGEPHPGGPPGPHNGPGEGPPPGPPPPPDATGGPQPPAPPG